MKSRSIYNGIIAGMLMMLFFVPTAAFAIQALPLSNPTSASVTTSTATLGGTLSSGGGTITAEGITWGLTPNMTKTPHANVVTSSATSTGAFTVPVTGLPAGTPIYFNAYATNSTGASGYSTDGTFTTQGAVTAPTVTTPTSTSVTTSTATLGGNITSNGGGTITAEGITWGTSANPQGNAVVSSSTSTGVFTVPVTSLPAGTLIYFDAYATNSAGTTYSSDGTFTTQTPVTAPTVTTPTSASVTTSTATLGGNITSNGGGAITAEGITWGTSANPRGNVTVGSGTSTGVFTVPVTGFTAGTLIYFDAYATNSVGTTYSSDGTFTTQTVSASPYVATSTNGTADESNDSQRSLQRASDGGLILFFTSPYPGTLQYETSANGTTWSAPVQVANTTYGTLSYSSYIDASNNVYLAYGTNYGTVAVHEMKFTYGGSGSWSAGTNNTIDSNPQSTEFPSILLDPSGTLWVAYDDYLGSSVYGIVITTSTTSGTTWSSPTLVSATTTDSGHPSALVLYNNTYPMVFTHTVVGGGSVVTAEVWNGSSWSSANPPNIGYYWPDFSAVSVGNNVLLVGETRIYGTMKFSLFNASTLTWGPLTVISASQNDSYPMSVVTDGTNAWVLYGHYNGTSNNYDIYERKWNGSSWFINGTPLTTTGNNNSYPQTLQTISPGSSIPYVYVSGASSPYTVYYNSFASTEIQTPQVVTSTGSGSWTVPTGVTSVQVELWGGGGAGGGYVGGGAGAYVKETSLSVTPGSTITYVVASGGTGANGGTAAGGTGYQSGGTGWTGYGSGGGGGGSSAVVVNGTTYIASGGGGSGYGGPGMPASGNSGGAGGVQGGGGGGSGTAGGSGTSSGNAAAGTGGTPQTGTNGYDPSDFGGGGSSVGVSGNGLNASVSNTGANGSGGASGGIPGSGSGVGGAGGNGSGSDSGGGGGGTVGLGYQTGGIGGQPGGGGGGGDYYTSGGTGGAGKLIITYTASSGVSSPTVTTPTSASVTASTATLGGNITSNGGGTITAEGITWGITANPRGNATVGGGTSTGVFTVSVTSLPAGTLIYFDAYATNSAGTTYSSDGTFTTLGTKKHKIIVVE
jgi:hypothetical protein